MRRIAAVTVLATTMGLAVLSAQTTPAHACNSLDVDPIASSDPVAASEIIAEGRLVSYSATLNPPRLIPGGKTGELELPPRVTERMDMEIDRVLKGTVPGHTITILNTAWASASGGWCGDIASDKSGLHVIVGASSEDGMYRVTRTQWFYVGPGPSDDRYQEALERLSSYPAAASLPALGTGSTPSATTSNITLSVAALGVALLLASLSLRYMSRRPH